MHSLIKGRTAIQVRGRLVSGPARFAMGMTNTPRRWHKAVRWLGGLCLLGVFVGFLLPVWFPWLLKPVLAHYGMRFAAYERQGHTRFALEGLRGEWPDVSLEVKRIESVLPTLWLWRRFQSDAGEAAWLIASDWRVQVENPEAETSSDADSSMSEVLDEVVSIAAILGRELPRARLNRGTVAGEGWELGLPDVEWGRGQLRGVLRVGSLANEIQVNTALESESAVALAASLDAWELGVAAKLNREASSWQLGGEVRWRTNRATLSATFAQTGWWPTSGQLASEQVSFPAEWVGLDGYEPPVASLTLNLAADQFRLQAKALAQPANPAENSFPPPLEVELNARGNPEVLTLEQLELRSSGLRAGLTHPFELRADGGRITEVAGFRLALDAAEVPASPLSGKVEGGVELEFDPEWNVAARFSGLATNVAGWGMTAERIHFKGRLDGPVLRLGPIQADFEDGSSLSLSGAGNLTAQQLLEARWQFTGPLLTAHIPGFGCEAFEASGRAEGPFTNLTHTGQITLKQASVPSLNPFDARAEWRGTNLHAVVPELKLSAGDSALSLAGGFQLSAWQPLTVAVGVERATLERGGVELYALARPGVIRFERAAGEAVSEDWHLIAEGLEWRGRDRAIGLAADLHWPKEGRLTGTARQIALRDFSDFLPGSVTNLSVEDLMLGAGWTNGPVRGDLLFDVVVESAGHPRLSVSGKAQSGDAVTLERLLVQVEQSPALSVVGTIPVALQPVAGGKLWRPAAGQPLDLRAELKTEESFALPLGRSGELRVARPELRVRGGGTLESPSASVSLEVAAVEWRSATNDTTRPRLEQVRIAGRVQPARITLEQFETKLDGQQVTSSGEWPLADDFWRQLFKGEPVLDWSEARGRLQIAEGQVAALARYLPSVLAPEGHASVELALLPGKKLEGTMSLTNASTRPMGQLTPVREVAARVRFAGDHAVLEEFRGQIGGQPVRATGRLKLAAPGDWDYELHLQGNHVPLARSLEFLLRGDFDLRLAGGGAMAPRLTGKVILADGLFVQYATALMLSRPERPAMRPPYFSVTNLPFADWKLDVAVRGDRFLRMRTPVFNGVASANFKVAGTVREPVLTGEARMDSGRILFPFGALNVDQAYASLAGDDPRGPELLINASGRNYRYDLRLEVTGPADGANVMFSSTPPLSSEEILLLLTAGELPAEQTLSTQARAGRLATFLGRDFLSRYAGSDLAEERLTINTGENLTEEGKATYSVEYRLNDRWSLVGEYDRFNAVNAGVKWRILLR